MIIEPVLEAIDDEWGIIIITTKNSYFNYVYRELISVEFSRSVYEERRGWDWLKTGEERFIIHSSAEPIFRSRIYED